MNRIVREASVALHASGFPTHHSLCQQFAREVCEHALGGKPMGEPNPDSAKHCALHLLEEGKAFRVSELEKRGGLKPGDLLYKTVGSGGSGHVGIYLGDDKVAENSSVHWNRTKKLYPDDPQKWDARGIRTLKAFGAFQVVARLDESEEPIENAAPLPTIGFEGHLIEALVEVRDGKTFVQLRPLALALGLSCAFNKETGRIHLERFTTPEGVRPQAVS